MSLDLNIITDTIERPFSLVAFADMNNMIEMPTLCEFDKELRANDEGF